MRRETATVSVVCGFALLFLNSANLGAQVAPATVKVVTDTGMISPSPNQVLRLTAVNRTPESVALRFRTLSYAEGVCNPVCVHAVVSQVTTASVTLVAGAAVSIVIPNDTQGVRGQVLSDGANLRVLVHITDGTSNTMMIGE